MKLSRMGLALPSPVAVFTVAGENGAVHQESFCWLMPCSEDRLGVVMPPDSVFLQYLEAGSGVVGVSRLQVSDCGNLGRLNDPQDPFLFPLRDDEPLLLREASEAALCIPEYTLRPEKYSHYLVMLRISQTYCNPDSRLPLLLFPQGRIGVPTTFQGGV